MILICCKLEAKSLVSIVILGTSLFLLHACGSGGDGGGGGGTGSIAFTAGISDSLVADGGQFAAARLPRNPSHVAPVEIPSKQILKVPLLIQQSSSTPESTISQKLLRHAWLFAPSTAHANSIPEVVSITAVMKSQLLAQVADDEIDCDLYEIDEIKAYVYSATGRRIAKGGPWPCSQHGGTIVGVPAGENLKLEIIATEMCSREHLFKGDRGSAGDPITVLPGRTTAVGKIMLNPVHNPWEITTVDTLWCEGIYDAVNTSIAVGPEDESVHISYYDCGYDGVKYATNNSGSWITEPVEDGDGFASIDVDLNSRPHVSYIGYESELYYTTKNESGSWEEPTVLPPTGNARNFTSIAIDSAGNAYISCAIGGTFVNSIQIFFKKGVNWPIVFDDQGDYASFTLDSSDFIYISYYDEENGNLLYASNANAYMWSSTTIDSEGNVGEYPSIAVNQDDGGVHIVYYDITNGDLKYAMNENPTSPDSPWQIDRVDEANDVGLYPSIAIDSSGYPHISYYDLANGDLKYARGMSGCWVSESVDTSGDVGLYTSIAIDSKDNVHISYIVQDDETAPNGALKYATKKILR